MKVCHQCGKEWTRPEQPGFKQACPKCTGYLHACLNCRLYNPSADRCSSITAECTGARDGLNYCEEFQFKDAPNNTHHRNGNGRHGNRRTASSLGFNRQPDVNDATGKTDSAARKTFDNLFGG